MNGFNQAGARRKIALSIFSANTCPSCPQPRTLPPRHSRRTPTPERLRFEQHRRRGGSSQRDERNGGGGGERRTEKRRSADEGEHSKSLPPQSQSRERAAAKRERSGGKTEAEVEAERKAKAEKDEADFQVGT